MQGSYVGKGKWFTIKKEKLKHKLVGDLVFAVLVNVRTDREMK